MCWQHGSGKCLRGRVAKGGEPEYFCLFDDLATVHYQKSIAKTARQPQVMRNEEAISNCLRNTDSRSRTWSCGRSSAHSLPVNRDVRGAKERLKTIKVYPLDDAPGWKEPQWLDITGKRHDVRRMERQHQVLKSVARHDRLEPAFAGYHNVYGELAAPLRHWAPGRPRAYCAAVN